MLTQPKNAIKLTELPNDLLHYIFGLLPKKEVEHLSSTCQSLFRFYTLSFSTSIHWQLSQAIVLIENELGNVQKNVELFQKASTSSLRKIKKNPLVISTLCFGGMAFILNSIPQLLYLQYRQWNDKNFSPDMFTILFPTFNAILPFLLLIVVIIMMIKFVPPVKAAMHWVISSSLLDSEDTKNLNNLFLDKHSFFKEVYGNYDYLQVSYGQIEDLLEQMINDFSDGILNLKAYDKSLFPGQCTSKLDITKLNSNEQIQRLMQYFIEAFNKDKISKGQENRAISYSYK